MLRIRNLLLCAVIGSLLCSPATRAADPSDETVKVFILAGQSNMEGKATNELFNHQATAPETRELFAHLRRDDQWIVRDDVFIKFLDRHGPLTLGYGSPDRTGPELEFGTVMGDRFDEPVLLIKAAWGGHSLFQQFRPPSSGLPDESYLQEELAKRQRQVTENNEKNNRNDPLPTMDDITAPYGVSYRNTLAEVHDVQDRYAELFPELQGRTLELAGFVWFQGWNDQYGSEHEYAVHMRRFIEDLRKDLDAPRLPFVIAAMGQNGSEPAKDAMLIIQEAQLSMNDVPEFAGNVRAFRTDVLVDKAAEQLYPQWRDRFEEWKLVGSDHAYHYFGSAIWFTRIGRAMGDAMLELIDERRPEAPQE